jgi:hypothetical protein
MRTLRHRSATAMTPRVAKTLLPPQNQRVTIAIWAPDEASAPRNLHSASPDSLSLAVALTRYSAR